MSYQSKLVMCNMLNILNSLDTNKMNSLRMNYMDATSKSGELSQDYSDAKKVINSKYEYDDPEREVALDEIKDEFEFLKAENAVYQEEVELQIDQLNTNINTRDTYR